jgi:hypothetical protein
VPSFAGTTASYGGYYTLNSTSGTYQPDNNSVRGVSAFLVDEQSADKWLLKNIPMGAPGIQVSSSQDEEYYNFAAMSG